ncbi:MAG: hypothetical protein ONB44_20220 [candidate division KSB1 bacterium]|nr:hypothetical protein [candidate division KSB1 bacterium]MDZ7304456.1 hypothetical protein [candidate division KSB1 bacterium]MDZ7310949.1 hypothetical protein [candidate division KSB1 bacterium]
MSTIEILQEQSNTEGTIYRAVCRDWQTVGATPGAALDAMERLVAASRENGDGTVVIVQRFRPDPSGRFFYQRTTGTASRVDRTFSRGVCN